MPIEKEDGFSEQAIRLIATFGDTAGLKRLYARFHTGGEIDGSVLYPIAEVASYAVVAERDHVLGIDLVEPVRDPATGQTRERHRRIIVTYVDGYEGVGDNTRYGVTSFTIAPAR